MIVEADKRKYKLIENVRDAFNEEEFLSRYTPFYEVYDYIVGDVAYSKLRLKGFNNKTNRTFNKFNDYSKVEKYIKENCAYGCKYFVLERVKEVKE